MTIVECPSCHMLFGRQPDNTITSCPRCGKYLKQQSDGSLLEVSGPSGQKITSSYHYKRKKSNKSEHPLLKKFLIFLGITVILSFITAAVISGSMCAASGLCDVFLLWFGVCFIGFFFLGGLLVLYILDYF